MSVIPGTHLSYGQAPEPEDEDSEPEVRERSPTICPETGFPVPHSRRAYRCRCDVCRKPGERDPNEPDPGAEAEAKAKHAERERIAEETRAATWTTYNSGPAAGTVSEDALDDVRAMLEGDEG